jgi:hypothetical protein
LRDSISAVVITQYRGLNDRITVQSRLEVVGKEAVLGGLNDFAQKFWRKTLVVMLGILVET